MQVTISRPRWDRLYEEAAGQAGYFTTRQGARAGYSLPLLHKHIKAGRIERVQRGTYRLIHFPASENEEMVPAWLWSEQKGVISHQTALFLHGLSDVLPVHVHLTLPMVWRRRRFRMPGGIVRHHADIAQGEKTFVGPVPVTNAARTLNDCAKAALAPDTLLLAAQQAMRRGIATLADLHDVELALKPFGGLRE